MTGLARHFRDLLVIQDPRTLPLLEVSEDLIKRYGTQAQNPSRELLIRGLDRLAQCDAQYKQSKEPRLLVEITLMQLCRLSAPAAPLEAAAPVLEKKSPDVAVPPPAPAPKPAAPAANAVLADPPPADGYVPKRRQLAGQVSIKASAAVVPAATEPATLDTDGAGSVETN